MTSDARSVLLLGSSYYTHTLTDQSGTVAGLLQRRLTELLPGRPWRCVGRRLYMTEQTVGRALSYVSEVKPDVIVVDIPTYQFLHKAAGICCQRRWPALYGAFDAAMERLKALGGGSVDGAEGVRGAVFRLPRDLARLVIGAEVEQPVEPSMAIAYDLLNALLRIEDTLVVCALPKFTWPEPDAAWCLGQVEIARAGLKDYCDRRHIATFDLVAALAASGLAPGMAPDQLHLDTETNDFEAALVADVIAGSLA